MRLNSITICKVEVDPKDGKKKFMGKSFYFEYENRPEYAEAVSELDKDNNLVLKSEDGKVLTTLNQAAPIVRVK